MRAGEADNRDRAAAAAATMLLQAAIGYALLTGLSPRFAPPIDQALKLFDITPPAPPAPRPPPTPPSHAPKAPREEGAASPPNLRATPTPVVVPPPVMPPLRPPPIIAAPLPAEGTAPSAGAAPVKGPGTGSGGVGLGTGSGNRGDGPGGGGGGGTPAEWVRGRIKDSDYPFDAIKAGLQGNLTTEYLVDAKGRVVGCMVLQASGSPMLDRLTCDLVRKRYRYRPARDAYGNPVSDRVIEEHGWVIDPPETSEDGESR